MWSASFGAAALQAWVCKSPIISDHAQLGADCFADDVQVVQEDF